MKKILIAAALSTIVMINAAWANNNDHISDRVQTAFKKEFAQATDISWQKTDSYYKASFKINTEIADAYFTPEGELIGIIHNILSTQLPIKLQAALKAAYEDYWITDLFEFSRQDSNGYYITIQNADRMITLQSINDTSWSVFSKTKK